jgi:protein tyrosine phosphatase
MQDFWRLVWEQDARVVVMLTAESEGGQRKSHPYWLPDNYGPLKLKSLSEKKVSLESPKFPTNKSLSVEHLERPGMGRRRATNPQDALLQEPASPPNSETPHVIIRKLTLSHTAYPFQPLREITQLQYSSWPDFGAPAHPAQVLSLVEHCNAVVRSYASNASKNPNLPEPAGERPIVVHCSAGCGRTGTFCTVDSVLDQLKNQRMAAARKSKAHSEEGGGEMDVEEAEWLERDDVDLVAKTVEDLRAQRLSMVQTLRQFVLCYETVLEWLVREMPDRVKRDAVVRRSYHG